MSLRAILHVVGHVALPALAARLIFPRAFRRAWLLMLLANLVDLDHLFQDRVYDPNRCSIGVHPLHTAPAIAGYVLLLIPARSRMLGVGLLLHMAWDQVDCWWMQSEQPAFVSEIGHVFGDSLPSPLVVGANRRRLASAASLEPRFTCAAVATSF